MARRISNDGSDGRDAYARMQMYSDERRAVAAQQRAVGNWSVEGGRGGIAASQRNMSNQGSLKDMWRNGRIVQPEMGGQTPTGTQSRNSLNPAKTSTAISSGVGYDPSLSGEDYGALRQGYSSVGAGSKAFGSEASRAAGALARTPEPVRFTTDEAILNTGAYQTPAGNRQGILTTGAGVGALFGQSALPSGEYYIPGTTVTRPSGTQISLAAGGFGDTIEARRSAAFGTPTTKYPRTSDTERSF